MSSGLVVSVTLSRLHTAALVLGGLGAAVGLLVVGAWLAHLASVLQIVPNSAPVQFNAGVCFLLTGVGLIFSTCDRGRMGAICGLMAAVLGGLTGLQYLLDVDFGIDALAGQDWLQIKTSHPGRMSPHMVVTFLCLGLYLFGARRVPIGVHWAILPAIAFAIGLVAIFGYSTRVQVAFGWGRMTDIALPSALNTVVLAVGASLSWYARQGRAEGELPRQMPLQLGFGILAVAILLVFSLLAQLHRANSLSSAGTILVLLAVMPAFWLVWHWHRERTSNLEQTERQFEAFFQLTPVLLCLATPQGFFSRVNRQWQRVLGWSDSELFDRPFLELVHADDREATLQAMAALERGDTVEEFENRYGCKAGGYRILSWMAVCHGEQIFAAARDVTDERELVHAAKAAAEAKSRFLATVSHEIRTPLNGIIGLTRLLAQSPQPRKSDLQSVLRSAELLHQIVDSILDYSKIEAGKMEVEVRAFDLECLLEDVRYLFQEASSSKGLVLQLERRGDVRHLHGDENRLRQVLMNLVGNALKFSERGEVRVEIEACAVGERGALTIAVSDQGIGMGQEQVARLFQPFAQGDETMARRFGGTGLGLSIVHGLVTQMGGSIDVVSAPGVGSRFTIRLQLPVAAAEELTPPVSGECDAGVTPRLERVLVVEDNPTNRRVAALQLQAFVERVDQVESGEAALAWLVQAEPAPQLILMDCQMPGLDGYQTTQRIRETEATAEAVPAVVLAMTANALRGDRERCLAAGMDGYLTKPVDPERLRSSIRRWHAPMPDVATPVQALIASYGESGVHPVLQLARKDLCAQLSALRAADATEGDERARLIGTAAHTLQGTCGSLGFQDLALQASAVQDGLRSGKPVGAETMESLRADLHRWILALDRWLLDHA